MPTYRIDIAYNGASFHGYARQPLVRTVQGVLEEALFKLTGAFETVVAGRTDKGVHAALNVVSFGSSDALHADRLQRSLNRQLAPEIVALAVSEAADDFHARFSAIERSYVYRVLNRSVPNPFLAPTSWLVWNALDVAAMNLAATYLIGEHDFASFCRKAEGRSTVRDLRAASWSEAGAGMLEFAVSASSFCHQMVRSLVAALVDVGKGRLESGSIGAMLDARDRTVGRGVAPPHGLTLTSVRYPAA